MRYFSAFLESRAGFQGQKNPPVRLPSICPQYLHEILEKGMFVVSYFIPHLGSLQVS